MTQQAEIASENRLNQRIADFAHQALAGIDTLDFDGRQQLLRLVLEDVRVHGWQVELRLRIPLNNKPPADTAIPATTPAASPKRNRSPRRNRPPKEAVSRNDRLRSTTEGAQERSQRGGGHHPMAEHSGGLSCPQDIGVIDMAGPGCDGVHQRQHLASRTGTADQAGHAQGLFHNASHPEPGSQRC